MSLTAASPQPTGKPDYGIDAPNVIRNLFVFGGLCLVLAIALPNNLHLFGDVFLNSRSFFWPAGFLLGEGLLFVLYVKVGKFRHRDFMLSLYHWRGDEQVLDVGCGRGLLLAGAAKLVPDGHATGIDVWSSVDMGDNSPEATQHNLALEELTPRTTLVSIPAQQMSFPDATFDVIVSNLCLHNIYDRATRLAALHQIVRVLKPGGTALLSDMKLTGEYADELRQSGLLVEKRKGSILTTFPRLTVVIARKP